MLGNALPMTSHPIFQFPESSQSAQKTKIANLLGHALYALAEHSPEPKRWDAINEPNSATSR